MTKKRKKPKARENSPAELDESEVEIPDLGRVTVLGEWTDPDDPSVTFKIFQPPIPEIPPWLAELLESGKPEVKPPPEESIEDILVWHRYFIDNPLVFRNAVSYLKGRLSKIRSELQAASREGLYPNEENPDADVRRWSPGLSDDDADVVRIVVLAADRHPTMRIDPTPIPVLERVAFPLCFRRDPSTGVSFEEGLSMLQVAGETLRRMYHWLCAETGNKPDSDDLTDHERLAKEIVDANPGVTYDEIREISTKMGPSIEHPKYLFQGPTKTRSARRLWTMGYRSKGSGRAGIFPPGQ